MLLNIYGALKKCCFILIAIVLISTCGCGNRVQTEEESLNYSYELQYQKIVLPDGLEDPRYVELIENKIYFLAEDSKSQFVVRYDPKTDQFESIKLIDYNAQHSVIRLAVNKECYCYEIIEYSNGEDEQEFINVKLNCNGFDGTEYFSIKFDDTFDFWSDGDYLDSLAFIDSENLLISTSEMILQLDLYGNIVNKLDLTSNQYTIQKSGTDNVNLIDPSDNSVLEFNLDTFSLGAVIINGNSYNVICKGNTSAPFIGISNTSADYLLDGDRSQAIPLPEKEISGIRSILIDENNQTYIVWNNMETYRNDLYRVISSQKEQSVQRLTIAVSYEEEMPYNIISLIDQFNFDHNDCQIDVVTFSDSELKLAFAANEAPDMMLFSNESSWMEMPLDLCIRKKLLYNIEPFLEENTELSNNDIVPNVLACLRQPDGLYAVTNGFRIRTMYARKDLGAIESWTLKDFIEVSSRIPDSMMVTKESQTGFLMNVMQWCLNSFVDKEKLICNFDNQLFYDLLQLSKESFPSEYDETVFQNADDFLINYAFCLGDFSMLCDTIETTGDAFVYTGFPDANGGQFIFAPMIAITANCKYTHGALEFVLDYLTMRNTSLYIPVIQSKYEELLENMKNDFSEETILTVEDLVSGATVVTDHYSPIPGIVAEEAQAYFNNDKTVKQVAEIIQNRVSIYLAEQQ